MSEPNVALADAQAAAAEFRASPAQADALLADMTAKFKAAQSAGRTEAENAQHLFEGLTKDPKFINRLENGDPGAKRAFDEAWQKAAGIDASGNQIGEPAAPPLMETVSGSDLPFFARQSAESSLREIGHSPETIDIVMGKGPPEWEGMNYVSTADVAQARFAVAAHAADPAWQARWAANGPIERRQSEAASIILSGTVVTDAAELAQRQSELAAWRAARGR